MVHGDGRVWSVCFSADGGKVLSGGEDGNLKVWDAGSGEEQACMVHGGSAVHSVCFSADGGKVLWRDDKGNVKVWDAGSGEEEVTSGTNSVDESSFFVGGGVGYFDAIFVESTTFRSSIGAVVPDTDSMLLLRRKQRGAYRLEVDQSGLEDTGSLLQLVLSTSSGDVEVGCIKFATVIKIIGFNAAGGILVFFESHAPLVLEVQIPGWQ
jgi:hypothetical protein